MDSTMAAMAYYGIMNGVKLATLYGVDTTYLYFGMELAAYLFLCGAEAVCRTETHSSACAWDYSTRNTILFRLQCSTVTVGLRSALML